MTRIRTTSDENAIQMSIRYEFDNDQTVKAVARVLKENDAEDANTRDKVEKLIRAGVEAEGVGFADNAKLTDKQLAAGKEIAHTYWGELATKKVKKVVGKRKAGTSAAKAKATKTAKPAGKKVKRRLAKAGK